MNTKKILLARFLRASILFILFLTSFVALQVTNRIETVVCDNVTAMDTTKFVLSGNRIEMKGYNDNFASGYFTPYDLSKTIYTINFTDKPIVNDYVFMSFPNEPVEFFGLCNSRPFGNDGIFLDKWSNEKSDVSFYTKNMNGESKQFIRNFFLTEFICFLVGLLLIEIKNVWTLCCRNWNMPQFYISMRMHAKSVFLLCLLFTLLFGFLILRINFIKTEHVDTAEYVMDSKKDVFSLYDMSIRQFKYNLSQEQVINGKIQWSSSEIVEFPIFSPQEFKSSMNSVVFNADPDGGFKRSFIVQYLESTNYQNIRIFILTTLFALFFSQLLITGQNSIKSKIRQYWKQRK